MRIELEQDQTQFGVLIVKDEDVLFREIDRINRFLAWQTQKSGDQDIRGIWLDTEQASHPALSMHPCDDHGRSSPIRVVAASGMSGLWSICRLACHDSFVDTLDVPALMRDLCDSRQGARYLPVFGDDTPAGELWQERDGLGDCALRFARQDRQAGMLVLEEFDEPMREAAGK